jgi:phosphoinositide-3-kinase regulatory subunit 4
MVAGRSLSLQEMQVTPLTVFITEKSTSSHADLQSSRKHTRSKVPSSDSRRPSFAGRPDRHRLMSQDSSASDAEQVTELRRRLVALDALRMSQQDISSIITPVDSTGPATPRPTAPHRTESLTSVPSTSVQDKSTSGKTARSRGSLGADATKAAPAVASSPAVATGQLEIAAHMRLVGLESRASEPGSPNTEPKKDGLDMGLSDGKPYGTTYEGRDPGILSLLESAWQENTAPIDEAFQQVAIPGLSGKRRIPRSSSTRLNRDPNREVTLIAHFIEHESSIAGIVVSPDQSYYSVIDVAGKLSTWEANRLERSVTSKPRLRLDLEVRGTVTFVCGIPFTHCFAVAATDGSIEIVRVQVATSASSLKPLRLIPYRSYSLAPSEGYAVSMAYMTSGMCYRPC